MKHKLYSNNLLVVTDDSGSRLFKIESVAGKSQLNSVGFISKPQKFIHIYPEHNLIVTPQTLYTLNGDVIENGDFDQMKIIYFPKIVLLHSNPKTERICVFIWNGKKIVHNETILKLVYSDKYIALHKSDGWIFFDDNGRYVLSVSKNTPYIRLSGDIVVFDEVGNHCAYSLKSGRWIMERQQLIKVSAKYDFAIGVNLLQDATIYHNGKLKHLSAVSYAEIIDEARLFYVLHEQSKLYTVYKYSNLEVFAQNMEIVSYNPDSRILLLATPPDFSTFRISADNKINKI